MDVEIAGREISVSKTPFVIAEMSGNHNRCLDKALRIVDAAAESGAHALKLQTYTPATMTLDVNKKEFLIDNPQSPWHSRSLHDLYSEAYTPWEWHMPIFERCREKGLICFSTPFDETAVDFLETFAVPCYKIASFENTDIPLIRKVASTGKPMLISTGLATLAELDESVRAAREAGCRQLVLLKCTSSYPASPEHSNIRTIPLLRDIFEVEAGLSDHTPGIGAALAAVALGATVIEKHLTLLRTDGGVDAAFSLEPHELRSLVTETERAWQSLGSASFAPSEDEKTSLRFRRSLYVTRDIKAGELFTKENVRAIRPGFGLPPKFLDVVLGKKASTDINRGEPLTLQHIIETS